jgi:folylpolyglutamate synthase
MIISFQLIQVLSFYSHFPFDCKDIKNFDKLKWIQENTHEWTKEDIPILKPVRELNETLKSSLVECKWPGRNQIIESDNKLVTYYLDGAHTNESIEQFLNWFLNLKKEDEHSLANERNVLIFNYTGERDPKKFLEILMNVKFDQIAFSKLEAFPSNFSTAESSLKSVYLFFLF